MVLSRKIFDLPLEHAPAELRKQAIADAKRAVQPICFTEDDIRRHCRENGRWQILSPEAQTVAIETLLDSEYQYVTEAANEAIAEALEQYLDEEIESLLE